MKNLPLIAKIVFLLPTLMFGFGHLTGANDMKGMVPSWLPGDVIWVYLTGIFLLAGAIAIIINKKAKLASLLLAVLIASFAVFVHLPGMIDGDMMGFSNFFKDIGLAGAALLIYTQSKD